MSDQTNTIAIPRHLPVRLKRSLSSIEQIEAEPSDVSKLAGKPGCRKGGKV